MLEKTIELSITDNIELLNFFGIDGIIYQDPQIYKNISKMSGFTCTECFNL